MARGFLSGAVLGTVVAGLGLGTLSVMTSNAPEAAMPMAAADKVEAVVAQTPSGGAEPTGDDAALEVSLPGPDNAPQTETPAAPALGDAQDSLPDATGQEGPSVEVASNAPALATPPETPTDTAPQIDQTDPVSPAPDAPPPDAATPDAPAPQDAPAEQQDGDAPESQPETAQDGPAIGTPATVLTQQEGAVTEQRLPTIGDSPETEATQTAEPDAPTPLIANSFPVDVPSSLPRMAVLLIDDGSGPLGPEALESLPFPVTFVIDPSHPNPGATAAAYRELGFEVAVIADLPEGGAPADIEVALAGALDQVPQAVAVLENPAQGFGGTRQTVTQVAQYLAASGHGLVMVPRGLNTAAQLAAREGVPATAVFRDFDAEGEDANTIRRVLDQAAFRARQDGTVVMLGRLRADTISALLLWGLQDRSGSLALVPASTVLLEEAD